MSRGQWLQLSISGLSTDLFTTGSTSTMDWIDKGCYDPINRQIRFIGHGHYQDQRWHQYDEASNTMSNLADPPWDNGGSGAPSYIGHGYQHNAMDPATGDAYYRMYGGSGVIRRLTRATGIWDTTANSQGSGSYGVGALEWLPAIGSKGGLVCVIYDMVQFWDKATNTWSKVSIPVGRQNHPVAVRSVPYGLVLFGGGDGDNNLYSVGSNKAVNTLPPCPIGMGISRSVTTACPVSGDLIVIGGNGNARKYSVGSNAWSTLSFSGAPSFGSAIEAGSKIVAIPIAPYGVICFLFGGTGQAWLYRHT